MKKSRILFLIVIAILCSTTVHGQIAITETDTFDISVDSLLLRIDDFRGDVTWQYSSDGMNWSDTEDTDATFILNGSSLKGMYRARTITEYCLPFYSDTVRVIGSGTAPTVTTVKVMSIESHRAEYVADVKADDDTEILLSGAIWDTIPSPTLTRNKGKEARGAFRDAYEGFVENLKEFQTYYLRAFVTTNTGTYYGDDVVFTTRNSTQDCQSDCCDKMYVQEAIESLDFNDSQIKFFYDLLWEVDKEHSFHVFVRNSSDFMIWSDLVGLHDDLSSLDGVIHEVNHGLDTRLRICDSQFRKGFMFCGNVYFVEVNSNNTEHISIVEETIAQSLKEVSRYETYIEGHKDADNSFDSLLEELTAHAGGAQFTYRYLESGKAPTISGTSRSDGNLNGMLNFMVFLQYYLKTARLNYPDTYAILQSPKTLAYMQLLWTKSESLLKQNYKYSTVSGNNGMYQLIVDLDYFNAAYSEDLLNELNLIGISHQDRNHWATTYLK